MRTGDFLKILKDEMHTTVMATVDEKGRPVTRVIDIMLADDKTIYFLTAKGKAFYSQLMDQKFVSISGVCGGEGRSKEEASVHMKAISVRGTVQTIGEEKLEEIFEKNPYMKQIYPDQISRKALAVFCIAEGSGEFFDLSAKPIYRESFLIGGKEQASAPAKGYYITESCSGCGKCVSVCPQKCIDEKKVPFYINAEHCLYCGNCLTVCPASAVRYEKE